MGLREKTKFQVVLKAKGGEPFTINRSWLNKSTALDHLMNSLDTGIFAWGALLELDFNGALLHVKEYEYV